MLPGGGKVVNAPNDGRYKNSAEGRKHENYCKALHDLWVSDMTEALQSDQHGTPSPDNEYLQRAQKDKEYAQRAGCAWAQ